ncbi:hypothetical protein PGT21_027705 [Puccinia graminis f. sp. tritici]|uniref:Uncharacterized protein n=1 Tax=Puccinia graminis f. sp. tritici TaxID=56615 RepID=A0A5B0PFZ7_PUCGR|nr:hypothetical protein PGT21_027705 [Puccinia graminis f. sp. tritici]
MPPGYLKQDQWAESQVLKGVKSQVKHVRNKARDVILTGLCHTGKYQADRIPTIHKLSRCLWKHLTGYKGSMSDDLIDAKITSQQRVRFAYLRLATIENYMDPNCRNVSQWETIDSQLEGNRREILDYTTAPRPNPQKPVPASTKVLRCTPFGATESIHPSGHSVRANHLHHNTSHYNQTYFSAMDDNSWTGPEPPIINADGAIEYVRPYDHAVRRAVYGGRPGRRDRQYTTPPPPSLVLTRHIQTPANIFDTDEEADDTFAVQAIDDLANPPTPPASPAAVIADIPTELAEQLGILGTDPARFPLATQLLNHQPPAREPRPRHRDRRADRGDQPHIAPAPRVQSHRFPLHFQISNSVCLILLSGDIECYTDQPNRRARGISHTPLTITLGRIRSCYRRQTIDRNMMPLGYERKDPRAMNALSSICWTAIEEAQIRFRLSLLENIAPFERLDDHGPVPILVDLMQSMWQQFQVEANVHLGPFPLQPASNSDRVRMAHLRLHMIHYKYSAPASSFSYWTMFDREILALAQEHATYQAAHAQAILMRDAQLFNGSTTLASIPRADRRLPNDAEIRERLDLIEAGATLLESE